MPNACLKSVSRSIGLILDASPQPMPLQRPPISEARRDRT
jgi:hypothetical protein